MIICGGSESNQILVPEKDCWHLETLVKHPLNGSHFQQKWDNKDFLELLEGRVGASAALTDKVALCSGKQDPVSTMQKTGLEQSPKNINFFTPSLINGQFMKSV